MRIPRTVLHVLFPVFLCYYAAVAHASLQGRGLAPAANTLLSDLGRALSHLSLPASVSDTLRSAAGDVRQAVMTSALMRDSRPSPEQERRDFIALWADLEPARPTVPATVGEASGYPILIPGQD